MRTKVIEDGGLSLRRALVKSDPSGLIRCMRSWCKICTIEEISGTRLEGIKVSCYSNNIAYEFRCMREPCWDGQNSTSIYEGESAKNGAVRFGQHLDLYRRTSLSAKANSWMWEHCQAVHNGDRGENWGIMDFKPFIHGMYMEVLQRLLEEGVRIKDRVDDINYMCLNSKNQYYMPQFTRLNYRALLE